MLPPKFIFKGATNGWISQSSALTQIEAITHANK
jgi:hypothetical protein